MADDAAARAFLTGLGGALVATAMPTTTVEETLDALADRYGVDVTEAILPTGVLTVAADGGGSSLTRTSPGSFRFDQTQALYALVEDCRGGQVGPEEGLRRLAGIEGSAPSFAGGWRYLGFIVLIIGLCLRQNPGGRELLVTAVTGLVVAALLVLMPRAGRLKGLVPGLAALVTGIPVAILVSRGELADPWQVVIPLMAAFIPGALLTIGSLELTRGAFAAGTQRLVGGIHQLIVLAFGLALAITAIDVAGVDPSVISPPVGAWAPPVGVGLYAIGAGLAYSAPPSALAGLAVVIYAAWGTQQLVVDAAGSYVASFAGAVVAVLVALAAHHLFRSSPAPLLTLNPLFRILAPGGLGLIGVTTIATGGSIGADVGAILFTFLAVGIGLVTGVSLAESVRDRLDRE